MKHALGIDQRLPQFEAVAVAVLDPGEPAVAGVLALGIDPDSGGGKLGEQSVEVVDAVVDHGRLWAVAEVAVVGGGGRPRGKAGSGVGVLATPKTHSHSLVFPPQTPRLRVIP